MRSFFDRFSICLVFALAFSSCALAYVGGPRYVAGTSYFNPAVMGKPIVWANGILSYYTDLGDLSPIVPHSQANSMIAAAAAVWNAVPTAAVSTSAGYVLNPIGSSGLPVRLYITAVTGSSAMLSFELEQYP